MHLILLQIESGDTQRLAGKQSDDNYECLCLTASLKRHMCLLLDEWMCFYSNDFQFRTLTHRGFDLLIFHF